MAMKLVKRTADYTIYLRGDKRYAVKGADKKAVNGDDKVRVLLAEGLITVTAPAPKPVEETAAEADSGAAAAPTEDSAADEGEAVQ